MRNLLEHLKSPEIKAFCSQNGVRRLALFGSVLRGEDRQESDVDLLVEFMPGARASLFDMARMEVELSDLLGRKVDLRTPAELSRYFREDVMREAMELYAA